jgi:hypothetical protein
MSNVGNRLQIVVNAQDIGEIFSAVHFCDTKFVAFGFDDGRIRVCL